MSIDLLLWQENVWHWKLEFYAKINNRKEAICEEEIYLTCGYTKRLWFKQIKRIWVMQVINKQKYYLW